MVLRGQRFMLCGMLLALILAGGLGVAAQAPTSPGLKQIEACAIRFRDLGYTANFAASRAFRVAVDQEGAVLSVARAQEKSPGASVIDEMMRVEEIEDCIRRWKFTTAGDISVRIWVSVELRPWTIVVSSGPSTLTLAMPLVDDPEWQYHPASLTGSEKSLSGIHSIEACRADLTAAGGSASFADTAVYQVVADPGGTVSTFKPLRVPEAFDTFVQVKEFEDCVRRWRFGGALSATVSLSAGTKGEFLKAWTVSVSSEANTVTLIVPRRSNR